MKKILTTISAIIFSLSIQAQGLYLAPYVNFSKVSLHNEEDSQDYNNKGYRTLLPAVENNFVLGYGIDVGYKRTPDGFGVKEIYTGVGYLPFVQKYEGQFDNWSNMETLEGKTTLNYLRVPLHISLGFNKVGRFTPFFSLGMNMNYLLSYTDNVYSSYRSNQGNQLVNVEWEVNEERWRTEHSAPVFYKEEFTFDSWYYNRLVFNTYAAIGMSIKISKQLEGSLRLFNSMSLNNPENTSKKNYVGTLDGSKERYNPYEKYVSKTYERRDLNPRPKSQLRQTGLQLGAAYQFITYNTNTPYKYK